MLEIHFESAIHTHTYIHLFPCRITFTFKDFWGSTVLCFGHSMEWFYFLFWLDQCFFVHEFNDIYISNESFKYLIKAKGIFELGKHCWISNGPHIAIHFFLQSTTYAVFKSTCHQSEKNRLERKRKRKKTESTPNASAAERAKWKMPLLLNIRLQKLLPSQCWICLSSSLSLSFSLPHVDYRSQQQQKQFFWISKMLIWLWVEITINRERKIMASKLELK